jgi:hypothetical protein
VVSVTARPRFTPGDRTSGTHWTGGWVGPRAGLDTEARGKILCPCRESNVRDKVTITCLETRRIYLSLYLINVNTIPRVHCVVLPCTCPEEGWGIYFIAISKLFVSCVWQLRLKLSICNDPTPRSDVCMPSHVMPLPCAWLLSVVLNQFIFNSDVVRGRCSLWQRVLQDLKEPETQNRFYSHAIGAKSHTGCERNCCMKQNMVTMVTMESIDTQPRVILPGGIRKKYTICL